MTRCGSDGCDGPNRACSGCGAVLGTEWSDCWTAVEVGFLRNGVQLDALKPADISAAAGALRPFEREALANTLNGDTVQDLLHQAAAKWPDLSADAALRALRGLLNYGLLGLYEADGGVSRDLDAAKLRSERIASRLYTWLKAKAGMMICLSGAALCPEL